MRSGVVIVSGTSEMRSESLRRALPAVYRRIHCAAELTWMAESDVRLYLKHFLLRFLPDASPEDWHRWEKQFLHDSPWVGSRPISIDALKQFLMSRITEASVMHIGHFGAGSAAADTFQVPLERRADFLEMICDSEHAVKFLDAYEPLAHTTEQTI